MRRSSICLVLLFLSSFTIAQHHDAGSTPAAAPAPSPAPAVTHSMPAPMPSPSPAPSPSSSMNSPSPSPAHSSPPASTFSESHAGASGTPVTHQSAAPPAASSATVSSGVRIAEAEHVASAPKVSGEEKISGTPRIGENPPEKDHVAKPAEPDLRHKVCEGCKDVPKKIEPAESDLRQRVCPNGPCACPTGQTAAKGGCVASPEASTQCLPGQTWNGANCTASTVCPAGEIWNGASCQANCANTNGLAANLIIELRSLHRDRDSACRQDPSSTLCQQLDGRYRNALGEYNNVWAGAPTSCRGLLPVPETI